MPTHPSGIDSRIIDAAYQAARAHIEDYEYLNLDEQYGEDFTEDELQTMHQLITSAYVLLQPHKITQA